MSRIRIVHRTVYDYLDPVAFGPHRLVIRPREGHDVRVERMVLEIEPAARLSWHRDVFGNSIAVARFDDRSARLSICSEVEVWLGEPAGHPLLNAQPVNFPPDYSPMEMPLLAGYINPVYPQEAARLRQWVTAEFSPEAGREAVGLVQAIGMWINRRIKYRRREDRGVQSPLQTLDLASGSCRDMATLLMEAVRTINIPSRFASGYLNSSTSAAGRASTHAWTELYFPEHGWSGFDPTIGEGSSHKHIVTGVSSHPRGVMPVTGAYLGSSNLFQGMTVGVQITPLGISPHTAGVDANAESPVK